MARVARGHDAVKEVHAARDTLDDVRRCADAHQIARLVLRHIRLDRLDDLIHRLRALADRQTANGVARKLEVGDHLHMLDAQIGVGSALIDAPEHLLRIDGRLKAVQPRVLGLAAHEPAIGARHGLLDVVIGRGIFDAFVKGHADIRAEI